MRPTAFWDCAGLLCLSYFKAMDGWSWPNWLLYSFYLFLIFFFSHHRALSEKELKSVSPEKSLQERLLQFFSNVLIPNLIATLCSMKSMVYISFTTATISMLIPQDIVDGRPVPVFFYDFYVNSTRYCGRKASSSLLQRSTHDLSYISKLYPFRVFGLLQFPDGPAKAKGWKSFQDLCRGFNDFCTGNSPLRHST